MEALYRKRVEEVFSRLEKALRDVDPDLVECELAQGTLTLTFADHSRCILSTQPSVEQIWLALASRGTAYHFNYDAEKRSWWDDKGKGVEIFSFLMNYLKEMTGLSLSL
ncbi:iron donor protein CyaY [bacterium]|jgi:CyaY protein|nr:iron donor protein CyaY [bacterium]